MLPTGPVRRWRICSRSCGTSVAASLSRRIPSGTSRVRGCHSITSKGAAAGSFTGSTQTSTWSPPMVSTTVHPVETVPGEGFVEFHLRLAGILGMTLPGSSEGARVEGPRLLIMYQPPGVDSSECVLPGNRHMGVSLYCKPRFLAQLAQPTGISNWSLLTEIARHPPTSVWHQQSELRATRLSCCAASACL